MLRTIAVAEICHEVGRVLARCFREPVHVPWSDAPEEIKVLAIDAVSRVLDGAPPREVPATDRERIKQALVTAIVGVFSSPVVAGSSSAAMLSHATAVAGGLPAVFHDIVPTPAPANLTTKAGALASALNGGGCLGRSRDDEPVFVLCARDVLAPIAVRKWADELEGRIELEVANTTNSNDAAKAMLQTAREKVADARRIASTMEAWDGPHKLPL